MSLLYYECRKTWKNSCDKRGPMISVSARPNVNQESDMAAKQMKPTWVCSNSFCMALSMDHHIWVLQVRASSLGSQLPSLPFPSFLDAQPAPLSYVRGPLPHPDTLAITNSSLPTKSCRKLAWKASAQCFGQLLFLASFSPLSRLCFNRTWDLTIFWGHSNFSRPLAGCHLPPQSSSCTCWKFQPFLHLTLLLLLNPQSPTRKTPWFCSPFKDMYSYHAWCVSVGISGWGSHVHLMEWGTASQESLY